MARLSVDSRDFQHTLRNSPQLDNRNIWSRLKLCSEESYRRLEKFRLARKEFVRQSVGHWYYKGGATNADVPINIMGLLRRIYGRVLGSHFMQGMVTTDHTELKALAVRSEVALNAQLIEMDFSSILEEVIVDSLFMFGVMWIGYEQTGVAPLVDQFGQQVGTVPIGRVYADSIDLDDWVHDMHARKIRDVFYCGHKYRRPFEEVFYNRDYPENIRSRLTPSPSTTYNQVSGDQRTSTLSTGPYSHDHDSFVPQIELQDFYLPEDKLVVTMTDQASHMPLEVKEWTGPTNSRLGMYHFLGYEAVPDNTIPSSPASHTMTLHEAVNGLAKKVIGQGIDQKDLTLYDGSSAEDAERIVGTGNSEAVKCNNVDGIKQISTGGPNPPVIALMMKLLEIADDHSGNLSMIGGLGQQAETARQEALIKGSSGAQVQDMQSCILKFVKAAMLDISYYWWHDDLRTYEGTLEVPGTDGIRLSFQISPEDRRDNYHRLNFDVSPYSMQHMTPQEKMEFILSYLDRIAPWAQSSGVFPDIYTLNKQCSKLANMPELAELFVAADGREIRPGAPPVGEAYSPKPATTTRNYNRRSAPPPSLADTMIKSMLTKGMSKSA